MPLRQAWEPLERDTVVSVPDRYGIYELADDDETILVVDHGPLRDSLKEALSYHADATKVRYRITANRPEAVRLVEEHRARLEDG